MAVWTITKDPQAINAAEPGTMSLFNLDLQNPVYIAQARAVSSSDDQIPPLGQITVDTSRIWYASSGADGVDVQLQATGGGVQISPSPAQVAEQIALSGVSFSASTVNIVAGVGDSKAGAWSETFGPYDITQPSWEMAINGYAQGLSGWGPFVVNVQFWDPTDSYLVGHRTITWWPQLTIGQGTIIAGGPTRGKYCRIVINSFATTAIQSIFVTMSQSSRLFRADYAQQSVFSGASTSGVTLTGADPPAGIIASSNPSLATLAEATRQLPLWMGRVGVYMHTASGGADATLNLTINADEAGIVNFDLWNGETDSAGNLAAEVILPASQCTFTILNKNAATQQVDLLMTSGDSTTT